MTAAKFRKIALSLEGVEEYSHAGFPAFRVGGRKFASLASQAEGYGNLMLTPEQQAAFVEEAPEIFLPIPGGWGRMGHTHIRLAAVNEDVLTGALRTSWQLRVDQNAKTSRKRPTVAGRSAGDLRNVGIDCHESIRRAKHESQQKELVTRTTKRATQRIEDPF